MKIIIAGAGNIGTNLAEVLSKEKHKVTLIEKDSELAKEKALDTDALVIRGDASAMDTLKDAGIETADAVVAVTRDDKTNMMIAEIAKSVGVSKIIARVNEPGNEELFVKLGISSIVPTTQMAVSSITNIIMNAGEHVVGQLSDGKAQILEVVIPQKSSLIGSDCTGISGALLSSVYRNGDVSIADRKTKLQAGDVAVFVVKTETVPRLVKLVRGE